MEIVSGVVTALCGGVAAILAALALLRKAGHSEVRNALTSLWDWCEFEHLTDRIPGRVSRAVLRVLDRDDAAE